MTEKNKLRQFWDEFYGYELSDSEYEEYKGRLVKFLELLVAIDKRRKGLGKIEPCASSIDNVVAHNEKNKESYMTTEIESVDVEEILNNTSGVCVLLSKIQELGKQLYLGALDDHDNDLYEFSKIVMAVIPFINSRLEDCDGHLPERTFSEEDANYIRSTTEIENQYKEILERALSLVRRIISIIDDEKDLSQIIEMLNFLSNIGGILATIPNPKIGLAELVRKIKPTTDYVTGKYLYYISQQCE